MPKQLHLINPGRGLLLNSPQHTTSLFSHPLDLSRVTRCLRTEQASYSYEKPLMKTQVTKISVLQTSKVLALVSPIFGLFHSGVGVIFIILAVVGIVNEQSDAWLMLIPGGILFLMPVLMFFMTFIFTALGSLLYNWVAGKAGGIEFEATVIQPEALGDPAADSLA